MTTTAAAGRRGSISSRVGPLVGAFLLHRLVQNLSCSGSSPSSASPCCTWRPAARLRSSRWCPACRRPSSSGSPTRWASTGRCRSSTGNGSAASARATGAAPTATTSRCSAIIGTHLFGDAGTDGQLDAHRHRCWAPGSACIGAIRRYSLFDYLATVGAMIALSIPTFWFGLVVIFIFSVGSPGCRPAICTRSATARSSITSIT